MARKGFKSPGRPSRKRARQLAAALYRRDSQFEFDRCAYCGDPRECLDHVPPLSFAASADLDELRERGVRLTLVPCCAQCNSFLGASQLGTYPERLAGLYQKYIAKIKNQSWSDEELNQLGPGLRNWVESQDARNRMLIGKFRGVETRLLYLDETE